MNNDGVAYEIRLCGHLDARWAATLGAAALTQEPDGTTILRSAAIDQPALHGVLQRIRDLGLPLLSVIRIDPDRRAVDPSHLYQGEDP